ncbi:uncharacterized protein [Ptychodera flava]|uniref:uncharacterized protein n=1 Tax=Ptychodera flava TaxID=63121 RepID=UPI00396A28D5
MTNASVKIKIEGRDLFPAKTEGQSNVFSDMPFTLTRARWMEDHEAVMCNVCNQKFNQLRRKHHCRVCGRVVCNKCCKEKVPLPQLGYAEPERSCDDCRPITELITKSRSPLVSFQLESASGLYQAMQDTLGLVKILQLGGLQTLVYLSRTDHTEIRNTCAAAIQMFSTHTALHSLLSDAGAIKAVCSLLQKAHGSEEQTIINAISALMIFCKSPDLKLQAIEDGALQPVMQLCSAKEEIALLAMMSLSLIVEHYGTHPAIIENDRNALPRILDLTTSRDEQMQEVAFRILATLSMSTDRHRQRLVQEDLSSGKRFVQAVNRKPKNTQVLCNAACLFANIATLQEHNQGSLQDYLICSCEMLELYSTHNDVITHVSRGIANFSKYKIHTSVIIQHLDNIIKRLLKSSVVNIQYQGVRVVLYLLRHSTDTTTSALLREGATDVLHGIVGIPGVMESAQAAILQNVPERAKPS